MQHPAPHRGHAENQKSAQGNDHALSMLFEILSSFIEVLDHLTAGDCYHFSCLSSQAHPQTIRRQCLQHQRLTHPDQHPKCPSEVPTLLTTHSCIISTNRGCTNLDCCGVKAVRGKKRHQ